MQLQPDVLADEAWREEVRHLLGQPELDLQPLAELQIVLPDAGNAAVCIDDLHIEPRLCSRAVKFQNALVSLTRKGLEPLACHGKINVGTGRWCGYCLRLSIIGTLREEELHGSLRPDPRPRVEALQQQLLALQRLGKRQAQLNMASMSADCANRQLQHEIDIKVITDGEHHVLDRLDSPYRGLFQMVITEPQSPKHLGFEAQRFLASRLDQSYDLYAYFEDDLIIHDPWFFRKIDWFRNHVGDDCLLLPHRVEFVRALVTWIASLLMVPWKSLICVM